MYDANGRLERVVTPSPWTDNDRALMLAFQLYKRSICDGCGQPRHLAQHPDNDGWYDTTPAVVCHGCTALRAANHEGTDPVKPVELFGVVHTRDYEKKPLPVLNLNDLT